MGPQKESGQAIHDSLLIQTTMPVLFHSCVEAAAILTKESDHVIAIEFGGAEEKKGVLARLFSRTMSRAETM